MPLILRCILIYVPVGKKTCCQLTYNMSLTLKCILISDIKKNVEKNLHLRIDEVQWLFYIFSIWFYSHTSTRFLDHVFQGVVYWCQDLWYNAVVHTWPFCETRMHHLHRRRADSLDQSFPCLKLEGILQFLRSETWLFFYLPVSDSAVKAKVKVSIYQKINDN